VAARHRKCTTAKEAALFFSDDLFVSTKKRFHVELLEYMHVSGNRDEHIDTQVNVYLRLEYSTDGYLQSLLVCFSLALVSLLLDFVADGGETGTDAFTDGVVRVFHLGLVGFVRGATGDF
jgi:hypothetical protein